MQPYAKRTLNITWKILIIDDDEEDFLIVQDMLSLAKGRKFEVDWAATYVEGQKHLANTIYDAVLVDYDLGLNSGIALIRAAKEQGYAAPLILFTGRGGYEVDIEAMQAGATLYLTKNEVNPLLLERSIRYAIELKQRENSLLASEAELRQSAENLERELNERKRAERELRESEAWFRTTLSSIGDAVITCNPQSEVTFLNPVAEKLTGWKQEEAIGESLEKVFNIINEQTRRPAENPVREVLQTCAAIGLANHTALLARDGREIPVEDSAAPIKDADGQITGIVIVFHDVSEQRKVTERLRYQADLLAQVQDAIIATDGQWSGTYWNKKAEEIFGWAREEIIGKPMPEILRSQFPDSSREQARKELLENGHWEGEVVYRRKDGSSFFAQVKTARLTGIRGERIGYVTSVRDITELKRASQSLEKSEEKFAKAFRSSPIALAISTIQDGRFIEINDSYAELYGYSREEVIGHTSIELGIILPEDRKEVIEKFRQGRGFRNIELRVRAKSGEIRNVLFSTEPIEIDGKEHMLSVILNITERKQALKRLEESNQLLERRVDERTAQLSLTNAELVRANRAKDEFLSIMSHELRTPLNGILNVSESLQEGIYGPLTERQLNKLGAIRESGLHLLDLIDDILDISKAETGHVDLQLGPVDLAELVESTIRIVTPQALRKRLRMHTPITGDMGIITGDARRLKQMLVNLISNAIKFTPEGGQIGLEVTPENEDESIRFTVWDTGVGIPEEKISQLFQPFPQIDSLSRQYDGTGIGLVLVNRLAQLHGGSVGVESEVGKGSQFWFVIPLIRTSNKPEKRSNEENKGPGQRIV